MLSESGLMTSVFEGSKDADEQPWKNISFMSAGARSINFNVLFQSGKVKVDFLLSWWRRIHLCVTFLAVFFAALISQLRTSPG